MTRAALMIVAKMGYAARGLVYVLVGTLSVLAAIAAGGAATGTKGALHELLQQPFGAVLVLGMAAGLVCYAAWRAIQAVFDADDHGLSLNGLFIRGALFISALTHLALAFYAVTLAFGEGSSSGQGDGAAWLMGQRFGRYLVGALGLGIIGVGLAHIWKGASGKFHKRLDFDGSRPLLVSWICGFGLIARGVVFCIVGGLLIYAAMDVDPQQAGGLATALKWLRSQPFGTALFAVIAVGLLAFGVYSIIEAIYRRIDSPSSA